MKIFKNKLFNITSISIFVVLSIIFWLFSYNFLESNAYNFLMKNAVALDTLACTQHKFCSNLLSKFDAGKSIDDGVVEIVVDNYSQKKYDNRAFDNRAILLKFFEKYTNAKIVDYDYHWDTDVSYSNTQHKKFLDEVKKMNNLVINYTPINTGDKANFELIQALNVKSNVQNLSIQDDKYKSAKISNDLAKNSKNLASIFITEKDNINHTYANLIVKIGNKYYPYSPLKWYLMENNTNDIVINDKYIYIPKTKLKIPYKLKNGLFYTNIRYYTMLNKSQYSHQPLNTGLIYDTYYALESNITPQNHPQFYEVDSPQRRYFDPKLFDNKIIVIGENLDGASADVLKTPMNARHFGGDIKCTVYDNLKKSDFPRSASILSTIFITLLLVSLTYAIISRCDLIIGLLLVLCINCIFVAVVWLNAFLNHYIMYFVEPITVEIVTMFYAYTYKFLSESRNKEKIKQAMGKYLSQDIMKNVVKNIDDLQLGGKRSEVTVLFSDIRGFTSLSEKLSAEEVSLILNEYFSEMEPIITKYNGVINKFIGDAVMVIFGDLIPDKNHAQNAVCCAYEMLKKVDVLRDKWLNEGKEKLEKFEIGIGINTGEVFIGNIGTEKRMEYTVIGDTVNLASRIESYNKIYKTNLLVSSSTYEQISKIADVIKINEVKIRGKSKKINIYEVLRISKKDSNA